MAELCCAECGQRYPGNSPVWRCECGGILDLEYKARFPLNQIEKREPTLWRYREAIPILDDDNIVSLGEGYTPLVETDLKGNRFLLKLEYLMPSGSFKDRGASVLISKAKELKVNRLVEDSSGNAGSAIAAYCALCGIECEIFVPSGTPAGKLAQIEGYSAKLRRIEGSRENVAEAALEWAFNIYYASHSWNPFFLQGTKTFAFEVCEQLGWRAPDVVVVPVGNGTLLLGAYMGFKELALEGIIESVPRIVAVQSAGCDPICKAFEEGSDAPAEIKKRDSIADGIAVAKPVRGRQILAALREGGGMTLSVSDKEVADALWMLCGKGLYVEPTGAVALAGALKHVENNEDGKTIVLPLTGSGLKETEKMTNLLTRH